MVKSYLILTKENNRYEVTVKACLLIWYFEFDESD